MLHLAPLLLLGSLAQADGPELLVERRCVACHAPPAALAARLPRFPASTLDQVGARTRPAWLAGFVGTAGDAAHDPDLLSGLGAAERAIAQRALPSFLAAQGGPFHDAPVAFDPALLERGRQLYHAVGCVACHAPLEVPEDLERPLWSFTGAADPDAALEPLPGRSLAHLPEKTGAARLADYLRDPLAARPSGEMPALGLDAGEARAIAVYLTTPEVRVDGPGFADAPGLVADYFEPRDPSRVDGGAPLRSTIVPDFSALPEHAEDGFAFEFRGFLEVPTAGLWRFYVKSDDGSRLTLDGELLIDNWGDHAPQEKDGSRWLDAGRHALVVEFYERGGGQELAVAWSGPGVPREPVPAAALGHWESAAQRAHTSDEDEPRARADAAADAAASADLAAGAAFFTRLRCGACHALAGAPPAPAAKPLLALDPDGARGCLDATPGTDLPRFDFAPGERDALAAALRALPALAESGATETADAALERTLTRLDCRACHARGGVGGPDEEGGRYFLVQGDLDLGDEGRLPPALDHVGWKLQPDALAGVLARGEGVRPYMRTRMPRFGPDNVGHLPALFAAADARPETPAPAFDPRDVELGRQLAGRAALGCIQCHDIAGIAGLGIPAADLARVHDRVSYGWFKELLLRPQDIGMNSRMPFFFADGKSPAVDVYGGDPERQVAALWTWLSLDASLPLPDGVAIPPDEYELVPTDRVHTVGVFLRDASARGVLVGFPERVHYAFDVENSSLRALWRGRFFSAEGTWHGRAGQLEGPMGEDVLDLPAGVPFAHVSDLEPWPTYSADELGYRVLGRRVAANGAPTFRYAFDAEGGAVEVAESLTPQVFEDGMGFTRRLELRCASEGAELATALRAAAGARVERLDAETFLVDGRLRVRGAAGRVVDTGAGQELRLPLTGPAATLALEYTW